MDDAHDPDSTGDSTTQVVQAVHHGVPVSAEITGELQGFRERTVDSLLGHQIARVEVADTPARRLHPRQLPMNLGHPLGNEDDPGFRGPCDVETGHSWITL